MKPEDELKTIDDAIALSLSRRAELVQLIKDQEKPKYKDGTPGYLWDDEDLKAHLVNLINTNSARYPYSGTYVNGKTRNTSYKNFTPLETCILGMKYRHDGEEYPGNCEDHILAVFQDGSTRSEKARKIMWNHPRPFDYYIIKRHEG